MDNLVSNKLVLGYDQNNNPRTCGIWNDPALTNAEIHRKINTYGIELDNHTQDMKKFKPICDLMKNIRSGEDIDKVCKKVVRLHPDGLHLIFPSNELSLSKSGFIEPLLPPLCDHKHLCKNQRRSSIMALDYLVQDFEAMCCKLKPHSWIILLDMGASLEFQGTTQPIMELISLYEKFRFIFDHVYAFDITFQKPEIVAEKLPEKYFDSSYHWINVGVSAEEGHKLNPLHSIMKKFNKDDLIIVKLDVDTPSIEVALAHQLLEDKDDGIYSNKLLIDQFNFEHHVHLSELAAKWKWNGMNKTIKDSFEFLFEGLRKRGIPAHSWP